MRGDNVEPLLKVSSVNAGYGKIQILRDVSLEIKSGEFVCLVGANGAGKTTTLRTISGFLKPSSGSVVLDGQPIAGEPPEEISRMGVSLVSEDLNLFANMTVQENLQLGAISLQDKQAKAEAFDFVYEVFPRLGERTRQLAGTMSGGERKMLAIARGLMSWPTLILVDEPSLGLAPQLASEVFKALQRLQQREVTILLVEQSVRVALRITDRAYVLENGRIVLEGKSTDLRADERVRSAYIGS